MFLGSPVRVFVEKNMFVCPRQDCCCKQPHPRVSFDLSKIGVETYWKFASGA